MSRKRQALTIAAAIVGVGVLTIAGDAVSSGATQRPAVERSLIGLPSGARLISQRQLAGNAVEVTYRYDGGILTIVAPRGSTSRASIRTWDSGNDGEGWASVTVPNQKTDTSSSTTPAAIYADAIAAGMPKADAKSMMNRAEEAVSAAISSRMSSNVILQPPTCASYTASSGNSSESCDAPEVLKESGATWWIGDEITTSGHYDSSFEGLETVGGRDNYTANNKIEQWRPNGSIGTNCNGSTSVSVTYEGFGLSSNVNACGGSISPSAASPTTGEGSYWNGCSGVTQGAPEVDGVYSPSNASDRYTQYVWMDWGVCWT